MRKTALRCILLCVAVGCSGQSHEALCPRHIETPSYPPLARAAHVTGMYTLTVTIDADGSVKHVEAATDNPVAQKHPLLQKYAIENMQQWTFAKPPSPPYTQVIVYDYEFDETLPPSGGPSRLPAISKVKFDLPDRVTILTNLMIIDVQNSRKP